MRHKELPPKSTQGGPKKDTSYKKWQTVVIKRELFKMAQEKKRATYKKHHKTISKFLSRNFAGHMVVACYIQSAERNKKSLKNVNIYAHNIGTLKYIKQLLRDIKEGIHSNTIEDFKTSLTSLDRYIQPENQQGKSGMEKHLVPGGPSGYIQNTPFKKYWNIQYFQVYMKHSPNHTLCHKKDSKKIGIVSFIFLTQRMKLGSKF